MSPKPRLRREPYAAVANCGLPRLHGTALFLRTLQAHLGRDPSSPYPPRGELRSCPDTVSLMLGMGSHALESTRYDLGESDRQAQLRLLQARSPVRGAVSRTAPGQFTPRRRLPGLFCHSTTTLASVFRSTAAVGETHARSLLAHRPSTHARRALVLRHCPLDARRERPGRPNRRTLAHEPRHHCGHLTHSIPRATSGGTRSHSAAHLGTHAAVSALLRTRGGTR